MGSNYPRLRAIHILGVVVAGPFQYIRDGERAEDKP